MDYDAPLLDEAEAQIFSKARMAALKLVCDFVSQDLDPNNPDIIKLRLKQLEIAQGLLSLSGRIDPTMLRTPTTDELGEMLASLKAKAA